MFRARFIFQLAALLFAAGAHHATGAEQPRAFVASASNEGDLAIKRFQLAPDLKVDLWAAEPALANPVAFNFDEKGRAYVCETFRLGDGVDDIRSLMPWLDEELASRSVDERLAEMKRHLGDKFARYSDSAERIRLIEDTNGDGKADRATVFADGFNTPLDGIGAGVLVRKGTVYYANIPNLWMLRDTNADGVADVRKSLSYGYGVRVGFLGHDLHGLHFGPDGKLYFSIGDRGSSVRLSDGRVVGEPESGCVFRCNPDGSALEVFCYGLRNPQDLVFDDYGNLFTGDNNSDSGDQARWVYLVEGADNGWRVGYQFMENPYPRGPFNEEKLWHPHFEGQAAYIVPPIANIADGPSGVAYYPGTGLLPRFKEHFFLVDFRGGATDSGIHAFKLRAQGAGFDLLKPEHFLWGILATDVKFGPDGGVYVSDWVEGWGKTGKGRLYRIHAPSEEPIVLETKRLLAQGLDDRPLADLARLLAHPDIRVRQEAQFELVVRGAPAVKTLAAVARSNSNQLARLHAIWGLGQLLRSPSTTRDSNRLTELLPVLLQDKDPEVRAQVAKVLGETRTMDAYEGLVKCLGDSAPRVRFFAALSLGKLGRSEAVPAILAMLRENANHDPWLRHAGVMALTRVANVDALVSASNDPSPALRTAVLLALRRLHRPELAVFLKDPDPAIVLEAARAINDEPINGAMPELAELASTADTPLTRRVLNANFHLGGRQSARTLAAFAARANEPAAMRVEALQELAQWEHPSARDRVVGLWRPATGDRPIEDAVNAFEPLAGDVLATAPDEVRIAAARTCVRLRMTGLAPALAQLAQNTNAGAAVRVEALDALFQFKSPLLATALESAHKDPSEDLKKAATRLEGLLGSKDAPTRFEAQLQHGTPGEQQQALAALARLANPQADEILGQWLDKLLAKEVPPELRLDLIKAAENRETPAIKQKLARYHARKQKLGPLAEYDDLLFGGNAPAGKKIFFDRPDAQCVRCHKVNGQGGDVGPDLSHVAGQKQRNYLLESIVFPNNQIAPGFESAVVTLKNDDVVAGVVKSETGTELVLNSPQTGIMRISKTDIASRNKALSPMPEGMAKILSREDLRDLVEFLAGLK